jgi:hypothetical protein
MRLAVSKSWCLKGFSTLAYKGAWRGHHDGTRADTIWRPRLSPIRVLQGNLSWACLRIRHKLLRPVSVMGFPATGPPGRQSAIPPPWATLACWFRTTSLVYLFGISPTPRGGPVATIAGRRWTASSWSRRSRWCPRVRLPWLQSAVIGEWRRRWASALASNSLVPAALRERKK